MGECAPASVCSYFVAFVLAPRERILYIFDFVVVGSVQSISSLSLLTSTCLYLLFLVNLLVIFFLSLFFYLLHSVCIYNVWLSPLGFERGPSVCICHPPLFSHFISFCLFQRESQRQSFLICIQSLKTFAWFLNSYQTTFDGMLLC